MARPISRYSASHIDAQRNTAPIEKLSYVSALMEISSWDIVIQRMVVCVGICLAYVAMNLFPVYSLCCNPIMGQSLASRGKTANEIMRDGADDRRGWAYLDGAAEYHKSRIYSRCTDSDREVSISYLRHFRFAVFLFTNHVSKNEQLNFFQKCIETS